MKKIELMILTIFLFVIGQFSVLAETLSSEDLIISENKCYKNYYNIVTNKNMFSTIPVQFIKVDNTPAYCVEYGVDLQTGTIDYKESYLNIIKDDKQLYDKISLIGLYGYNYKDHKSNNYYGAAQLLIWQAITDAGKATGYSVNNLNLYTSNTSYQSGELINLEKEKEEIMTLVNDYYKKPSFCGKSYKLKEDSELTLIDENDVLENYEIILESNNDSVDYDISNSKLTLYGQKKTNDFEIIISKGTEDYPTTVFAVGAGQNVIITTDYPEVSCKINVDVEEKILEEGYIKIKKVDKENNNPLKGVIFKIYDENNKVIDTVTTNESGIALSQKLPYGKYFVKEIETIEGYLLNESTFEVKIDSNNTFEINVTNEKEEIEQVATSDALIGFVWFIGLFALGFGIHYYKELRV